MIKRVSEILGITCLKAYKFHEIVINIITIIISTSYLIMFIQIADASPLFRSILNSLFYNVWSSLIYLFLLCESFTRFEASAKYISPPKVFVCCFTLIIRVLLCLFF